MNSRKKYFPVGLNRIVGPSLPAWRSGWAITVIAIIVLLCSTSAFGQQSAAYTNAREKLVKILKRRIIDSAFTQKIDQFYYSTCDSLVKNKVTVEDRSIEVILTRLFDACENKISSRFMTLLRIPSVNDYFLLTLQTYNRLPLLNLYREIGITQSAILEFTFDGLKLGDSISNIVGIREMLNNPYLISGRLHQPKYAPYKDTLLYFLANAEPAMLNEKLVTRDSLFTQLVQHSNNRAVKAVSQVEQDIYYDQVLPFGMAILEGRATADSIRKLTLTPYAYYRALVDEITRLHTSPDPGTRSFLKQPIAALNKTLANKYFISEINLLHDSPDKERYQVIKGLGTRELYFLLVGGSSDMFTSSFLYVYKKFIKAVEKEGWDKFLEDVDYYQFDQFITNVLEYGLVNDLVDHVQEEKFARFIAGYFRTIASTQLTDHEIILKAMTTAEVLNDISNRQKVKSILLQELEQLAVQKTRHDILLQRIFSGFTDILQQQAVYHSDTTYDVLRISRLKKNNAIVQVCFFYDDEDGITSFNNSVSGYNPDNWQKEDKGNYIVLQSREGNHMRVYMNKPMTTAGCDTAQDEMLKVIAAEGYEPTSFIHRGHSYHLFRSLQKITPSCQFVFLGSCGGYNEVLKVFQLNPDVNIIVTRNIGSKLINDPLLQKINKQLVENKDITWNELWQEFNARFQSKHTRDLFSAYIPPNKYVGVKFARKLFNF